MVFHPIWTSTSVSHHVTTAWCHPAKILCPRVENCNASAFHRADFLILFGCIRQTICLWSCGFKHGNGDSQVANLTDWSFDGGFDRMNKVLKVWQWKEISCLAGKCEGSEDDIGGKTRTFSKECLSDGLAGWCCGQATGMSEAMKAAGLKEGEARQLQSSLTSTGPGDHKRLLGKRTPIDELVNLF